MSGTTSRGTAVAVFATLMILAVAWPIKGQDQSTTSTANSNKPATPVHSLKVAVNENKTGPRTSGTATTSKNESTPAGGQQTASTLAPAKNEIDFDSQTVDSTGPVQTVTVTIEPPLDSSTKISTAIAGDFVVTPATCDLKGSGKCAFSVSFAPKSEGASTSSLTITAAGDIANQPQSVDLTGNGTPCGTCTNDSAPPKSIRAWFQAISPIVIVALLYLAGIVVVRWQMIARPTRALLHPAIDSVRAQLNSLKPPASAAASAPGKDSDTPIGRIEELLTKADRLLSPDSLVEKLLNFLLWNSSHEIAAWNYVHEAQQQMALLYPDSYDAFVVAELEQAVLDLQKTKSDVATGMAGVIDRAVKAYASIAKATSNQQPSSPDANPDDPPATFERLKGLLNEALGFLYDQTDTKFCSYISWNNKTMWLIGAALLLIVSLGASLHRELLFLVGATGGLLSRLSRSLQRDDVPTDYGASWTTLFLSPVVGALGGWCGVLLLTLGSTLNIVGSAIKVDWCNVYCPVGLGAALLFGVSERAFDTVLDQLDKKVAGSTEATSTAQTKKPDAPKAPDAQK
jgi:hypothetical protein